MLKQSACGFATVALAGLLAEGQLDSDAIAAPVDRNAMAPRKPHFQAKAKNIIFLYMDGGPSQVDTFDPKPRLSKDNGKPFSMKIEPTQFNNIGNTLASPWKFAQHGQSGTPVSELFPHIAKHVDDLAIIRSMTKSERKEPAIIDGSRRKRIADGSGTKPQDVNRVLKQFKEAKKIMQQIAAGHGSKTLPFLR